MGKQQAYSDSQPKFDTSVTDSKELSGGRFKARKYANRQFQERRKPWATTNGASNDNFRFGTPEDHRTFSISSESNTSRAELKACGLKSEEKCWFYGCSIWTEQQLKNSIDELLGIQEATLLRMKTILGANEQSGNWSKLPSYCYNAGILYAAISGDAVMLRYFLQRGANPKTTDSEERSVMHYASSSSASTSTDCILLLREYGADVNVWDKLGIATPLICAAASGNSKAVMVLIHAGADVNAGLADPKYPDSSTPLVWAIRSRCLTCAIHLLEAGAAVNSPQVNILTVWTTNARF